MKRSSPNSGLSPRWHTIILSPQQQRLWDDQSPRQIIHAGRRAGKSELAKRAACLTATQYPAKQILIGAPTQEQVERIYASDVSEMLRTEGDAISGGGQSLVFTLPATASQIHLIGLDRPERAEGHRWDEIFIDEFPNCKPQTWHKHLSAATIDTNAQTWLMGVPDNDGPSNTIFQTLADSPWWNTYTWPSTEIHQTAAIEHLRREMDQATYQQEVEGRFTRVEFGAFPQFDKTIHVKPQQYISNLPIRWSLDFNIDRMHTGVIQEDNHGFVYVLAECNTPNTGTEGACDELQALATAHHWNLEGLEIYGDATGNARDTTSATTDWQIIREQMARYKPLIRVPRSNPKQKDTINAVRRYLKSADGHPRIAIDPACLSLIHDLKMATWPAATDQYHALAWLRYYLTERITLRNPPLFHWKGTGTIGFSA